MLLESVQLFVYRISTINALGLRWIQAPEVHWMAARGIWWSQTAKHPTAVKTSWIRAKRSNEERHPANRRCCGRTTHCWPCMCINCWHSESLGMLTSIALFGTAFVAFLMLHSSCCDKLLLDRVLECPHGTVCKESNYLQLSMHIRQPQEDKLCISEYRVCLAQSSRLQCPSLEFEIVCESDSLQ